MQEVKMKVGQLFNTEESFHDSEMIPYYEEVHLKDGQVMVFQGELTTDLFIITSGKLEVVEGSGNTAVRLALLTENDVFGEVAFFDEDERSATVRSLGSSKLLRMTREHFADLTVTQPELAIRFLISLGKLTSGKLRRIDRMIAGVTGDRKATDDRDLKNLIRDIKKAMKEPRKGFFK